MERPRTAPHRSPTRPHYKEEMYKQSQIVLRYIGHPDHRARDRNSRISRGGRSAPMPAYLDEVTVLQQPRGSYTLEVFRGFLAVGDEFWFTSRRVEGFSFSLTIFVNKQCHVRLSACCETKRKVGTRLGQGLFQLVRVDEAEPCVTCLLEQDPIAQRHMAKISKYRGEYDKWGNRLTKSYLNVRHLLEDEDSQQGRGRGRRGKKKVVEEEEEEEEVFQYEETEKNGCVLDNYTFGNYIPLPPSLSSVWPCFSVSGPAASLPPAPPGESPLSVAHLRGAAPGQTELQGEVRGGAHLRHTPGWETFQGETGRPATSGSGSDLLRRPGLASAGDRPGLRV